MDIITATSVPARRRPLPSICRIRPHPASVAISANLRHMAAIVIFLQYKHRTAAAACIAPFPPTPGKSDLQIILL